MQRLGKIDKFTWMYQPRVQLVETTLGIIKRVAFRAETSSRVKDLRGFQKSYSLPDRATPASQKFIASLANEEIKADIDNTYGMLRETYGFKRKQLESSTDGDGSGFIHTPYFDYSIRLQLDPADPSQVIWRREVTALAEPDIIRGAPFGAIFGTTFDRLVFEFEEPMDTIDLVDRLEEEDLPGITVQCTSDVSSCVVTMQGFRGAIRIDAQSLVVEGRQSPTASSLLDQFLDFLKRCPGAREIPALR